jgi:hypothetical protein
LYAVNIGGRDFFAALGAKAISYPPRSAKQEIALARSVKISRP